jgi:hypothetical protein
MTNGVKAYCNLRPSSTQTRARLPMQSLLQVWYVGVAVFSCAVPSRGYERDCHAVETGPAMLSSESAPILAAGSGRHGFSRCARCCLGSGPTDAAVAFAISRSGMTARRRRLGPTVAGPRVSSNHRPGERASSGSSVVNMWKRFQMPAHSRKGPQRRSPLHALRWSGAEGATGGGPDAARLGRGRPSWAPDQP